MAHLLKIKSSLTTTRNHPMHLNVFLEGNIGSGKSTLIDHFSQFPNFETVPEPVSKWQNLNGTNIFKKMSMNPHENAFKFQSYVSLTLIEEYMKPHIKPIRILERSLLSQKCFTQILNSSGILDNDSYTILNNWHTFMMNTFNVSADAIIYIKTKPEILLQRINSRGRSEEKNIDLGHLKKIHDYHEKWLTSNTLDQKKIFIIDGNCSQTEIKTEYAKCNNFLNKMLIEDNNLRGGGVNEVND